MCSQALAITGHTEGFMIFTDVISLKDNPAKTHTHPLLIHSPALPYFSLSLSLSLVPYLCSGLFFPAPATDTHHPPLHPSFNMLLFRGKTNSLFRQKVELCAAAAAE